MKLTCMSCSILPPNYAVDGIFYCSGCYTDANYCDCVDCEENESPCQRDCDPDTRCRSCLLAAEEDAEEDLYFRLSSGAV